MHASHVPPEILARVAAIRGNDEPIALAPARTAHLIVDLQVGFMAPGAMVETPVARDIVPNVNRLCQAVRAAGGLNVFLRFAVDLDEPNHWGPMYDRMSPETLEAFVAVFGVGAAQYQLWPELEVTPEDLIVDKTRFSAFIPGTCDLHDILTARGIDTIIVTGTVTNCCCESTTRDAMQLGYKALFVADGNASTDDAAHNATLANMAGLFFADVVTADEAIARLGQPAMAVA